MLPLKSDMLITTSKVNNGVIQVETKDLPDGTTVTLLASEGDETFALDTTQEAELLVPLRKPSEVRFGRSRGSSAASPLSRDDQQGECRSGPRVNLAKP
jgi:hypothetical protein